MSNEILFPYGSLYTRALRTDSILYDILGEVGNCYMLIFLTLTITVSPLLRGPTICTHLREDYGLRSIRLMEQMDASCKVKGYAPPKDPWIQFPSFDTRSEHPTRRITFGFPSDEVNYTTTTVVQSRPIRVIALRPCSDQPRRCWTPEAAISSFT